MFHREEERAKKKSRWTLQNCQKVIQYKKTLIVTSDSCQTKFWHLFLDLSNYGLLIQKLKTDYLVKISVMIVLLITSPNGRGRREYVKVVISSLCEVHH